MYANTCASLTRVLNVRNWSVSIVRTTKKIVRETNAHIRNRFQREATRELVAVHCTAEQLIHTSLELETRTVVARVAIFRTQRERCLKVSCSADFCKSSCKSLADNKANEDKRGPTFESTASFPRSYSVLCR
jgi:hypothetical protein